MNKNQEDFKFESSLGRLLGVAFTHLSRQLEYTLKVANAGITADQFRVLTLLWDSDGQHQIDLAKKSYRNRANITRVMEILEREGIVYRKADPDDGRAIQVFLTEKGKSMRALALNCGRDTISTALQDVNPLELNVTKKVLNQIIQNLQHSRT